MKSISEIKEEFGNALPARLTELMQQYADDDRSGVQKLIAKAQKDLLKLEAERARTETMKAYEKQYRECGVICGIDEVGRGPLAGPVGACAVILPEDEEILYLNDSKQLSAKKRDELYDVICEKAVSIGIGIVGPERIDEINILQATYEAMREAVGKLDPSPDVLLNDAVTIPGLSMKQESKV